MHFPNTSTAPRRFCTPGTCGLPLSFFASVACLCGCRARQWRLVKAIALHTIEFHLLWDGDPVLPHVDIADEPLLPVQAKITPKYDPKAPQTSLAESAFTRRRELFVGRLAVRSCPPHA